MAHLASTRSIGERGRRGFALGWIVALAALGATSAWAQRLPSAVRISAAANFVLPQRSVLALPGTPSAEITGVAARVAIVEQVATTTLDVSLSNPGAARIEAELVVPVPDGAVVRGFTFEGPAAEPSARLLPKDEARRTYESIVARVRDPALLEFVGYGLVRSSVFPIEGHGKQRVRLTYEQILGSDGDRVDYVLPRSEALDCKVPWDIALQIQSKAEIATVFSPSHEIETRRPSAGTVSVRLRSDARSKPGPFQLSYLRTRNGVTASLMAYPDPTVGGGYFLLLVGLPSSARASQPAIKREVTLVLDHSGSMSGEKLEQVRDSALRLIEGLEPGELFNLFVYNEGVDAFATEPVVRDTRSLAAVRRYLGGVGAQGGTNIYDALGEALRQRPTPGTLPVVIFLTDGLPTVGRTSEREIRRLVAEGNRHERRIFTVGVGTDVNVPLLDRIATTTRGVPGYVLPGENVETRVAQLFRRLSGPVFADVRIEVVDDGGRPEPSRTRERIPAQAPDLFDGDQLVLLGQYQGDEPLHFRISGNYLGAQRAFNFRCDLGRSTTRNAFVPRLWASRKIGLLIDAVRDLGAEGPAATLGSARPVDARTRELTDEIVRLSTRYGILTEYTAFLAREGSDLSNHAQIVAEASSNLRQRAQETRVGLGAANQSANVQFMSNQTVLNNSNAYVAADMSRRSITNVQQVNDQAFYQRGKRWTDSRLVEKERTPDRVIAFGSREHVLLAERLARANRQGSLALRGEILLELDGEVVLVR
jgi:Ca-activated chloride channel homolog